MTIVEAGCEVQLTKACDGAGFQLLLRIGRSVPGGMPQLGPVRAFGAWITRLRIVLADGIKSQQRPVLGGLAFPVLVSDLG
jgi:hypothetical protein